MRQETERCRMAIEAEAGMTVALDLQRGRRCTGMSGLILELWRTDSDVWRYSRVMAALSGGMPCSGASGARFAVISLSDLST